MAYIEAEREVDRLQTENAKLREELEKWNRLAENIELPEYPVTEFHPKDLERENAKLRELVRDMHKALFSLNLDYCQACPREDACVFVHKSFDCDECAFERDMRELGIEEDE